MISLAPVGLSAAFLLLLVARLGLLAKVAQGRATALAIAMTEQQELQRELAFHASHDALTGLANRRLLVERIDVGTAGLRALLLLDLDRFKDVNDTFGHPAGDQLLVEASRRLNDVAPPGATLARLGGDEFAVLVDDAGPAEEVLARAESFVAALRQPYHIDGRNLHLTTSIGVLTIEAGQAPSASVALRHADLALYAAKAEGKNRVVHFGSEMLAARDGEIQDPDHLR